MTSKTSSTQPASARVDRNGVERRNFRLSIQSHQYSGSASLRITGSLARGLESGIEMESMGALVAECAGLTAVRGFRPLIEGTDIHLHPVAQILRDKVVE